MNSRSDILGMVCSEALEYGGVQEIPEHKHGTQHNYFSKKRSARTSDSIYSKNGKQKHKSVKISLKLIRNENGKIQWVD